MPLPAQARLLPGTFSNFAGTLRYQLYVASSARTGAPLFVMLHGGQQSATDFATGTRMNDVAEECGGIVLYPEQSAGANFMGCWNWYESRHQAADQGEPAMIAGMTRAVMVQHGVDARRVYVAGMSAGGAMAVILGQSYPDLYAAVGVHSGMPSGVATDIFSALQTMNNGPSLNRAGLTGSTTVLRRAVATIVFHGDCDNTVHPSNGEAVLAQVLQQGLGTPTGPGRGKLSIIRGAREVTRRTQTSTKGRPRAELWLVHGAGHAWTGGSRDGTFTDEKGPDASREMRRFFLAHSLRDQAAVKAA
ncbi:MAG: PHB depolymerase family esterase [Caldimonas sp.]